MQTDTKITSQSAPAPELGKNIVNWAKVPEVAQKAPALREFSMSDGMTGSPYGGMTLQALIEGIRGGRWQSKIEKYRHAQGVDRDSLKVKLTAAFPSLHMRDNKSKAFTGAEQYTGIVVLDIDDHTHKDGNPPEFIDMLTPLLLQDQYTLGYHRSAGGGGLAVYYHVDSSVTEHSSAYKQLARRLSDMYAHQYNAELKVDMRNTNPNRARFVSYDPEAYLSEGAQCWQIFEEPAQLPSAPRVRIELTGDEGQAILAAAVEHHVDLTVTEFDWFRLGKWVAQTYGNEGRELFHQASQFHPQYNTRQTDRKFDSVLHDWERNGKGVSENIPRILAAQYAPELLEAIRVNLMTKEVKNSGKTAGGGVNAVSTRNVTKGTQFSEGGIVSVALELSQKEPLRATTSTQTAYDPTRQLKVPENARKSPQQLRALLAQTRYGHDPQFMPPEPIITVGGQRFATAGNFSVLVGIQKAGKGFVLSAIVAAYLRGSSLAFEAKPIEGKPDVVLIDTEQDLIDLHTSTERLRRALTEEQFRRVTVYSWRKESAHDSLSMLPEVVTAHPSAGLIVVDGVADLSPLGVNDDIGARDVVQQLASLTAQNGIHLVTVIHLNKAALNGIKSGEEFSDKARSAVAGHLGINLQRKAETVLGVWRSADGRREVHPVDVRGKDFVPFGFTITHPHDMPQFINETQLEAIQATATNAKRIRPHEADISTHGELVGKVFTSAPPEGLSTKDLNAHTRRVLNAFTSGHTSERYASDWVAYWHAAGLIQATEKGRHPRQRWRVTELVTGQNQAPDQTPEVRPGDHPSVTPEGHREVPASTPELFAQSAPEHEAPEAKRERKKRAKRGGTKSAK